VGGTHVKLRLSGSRTVLKIPSGRTLTPGRMMAAVRRELAAHGWRFDRVSIGFPAPVVQGRILREPANLGRGWRRYDLARAFGKPVKVVNDAAMQALGSHRRGTMLFLGLGTGLGSALVMDGTLMPLELARLPWRGGELEDSVGQRGLDRLGKRRWKRRVAELVDAALRAFVVDDVVLGGGNARHLVPPPPGARLGSNAFAFTGGERLWRTPSRA